MERIDIENDVVGRQRQHHRFRIAALGQHGGGGDRGAGIAAHRLDRDGRVDAQFLRLAAREKPEIGVRYHDRRREQLGVSHPQQGFLIARALAHQRQELLGEGVARNRPKPRSGAASEQNRDDFGHAPTLFQKVPAIARLSPLRRESNRVIAIEPKMIDRILTVGGFTLLSRVTGFVRDIMLAAILGAGPVADAFFVALRLPNHFRAIFGEGAFNAAFVPAYARIREANGAEPSQLFADRIFTLLLAVQIVLLAAALVFMPAVIGVLAPGFNKDPGRFALATELTRITFPYLLLISLVTLYSGILNALGRFATPAAAPILLNLSIMMTLALAAFFPTAGHAAAWGVLIAGVLEVILVAGDAWKRDALPKLRWPQLDLEMKGFLKRFGPATVGSAETQIALFADTIIASFLVAGSLSALYYADRLNQLPDRCDRHRGRHRAAARDGAAHRGGRRGWRTPFAEPRHRADAAARGALHGGVPDRAGIDHARVVRPRRIHGGERAGGRRHACGLCARSTALRPDAQRDRDVPFARRHHHAGQGAVRRRRRQRRSEDCC